MVRTGVPGPAAIRLPTVISILPTPPGDRRPYFGIAEIECCRLQRRLGRLQIGFGLAVGVDATVEVALRDRAQIRQLLAALEIALGEDQARLGRGHLAFGARHIGRIQRRDRSGSTGRPV